MDAKTNTQGNDSLRPYKQKLLRQRELAQAQAGLYGTIGGLTYDRVKLLVEVFLDKDFRADSGSPSDDTAAKVLDAEVLDLGFEFLQLHDIFQTNPDRKMWEDVLLADLYLATLESHKQATKDDPIATRWSTTKKEFDAVAADRDHQKAVASKLGQEKKQSVSELASLRQQVADLEDANHALRKENDSLRAALAQTETLVC